jgi:hypothetical protein
LESFAADQLLDGKRTPKPVAPLSPAADRLQLDLVGQELPRHLSGLNRLPTEERCHLGDTGLKVALEMLDIDGRDARLSSVRSRSSR